MKDQLYNYVAHAFFFIIFLGLLILGVWIYIEVQIDEVSYILNEKPIMTSAFIIENASGELDFIEIVFFNNDTNKVAFFHIPSYVVEKKSQYERLDDFYKKTKHSNFSKDLEDFIGHSIDLFFYINYNQLSFLIDNVSGINIFINDIKDLEEPKYINLDGNKTLQYLSDPNLSHTSLEKEGRQQRTIGALFKSIIKEKEYILHDDIIAQLKNKVFTNLHKNAIYAYIKAITKLKNDLFIYYKIDGRIKNFDNKEGLFPHLGGRYIKQNINSIKENIAFYKNSLELDDAKIRVEILNGTYRNGLGKRVADELEKRGYQVVNIGNAQHSNYAETMIFDRIGDKELANNLAHEVGYNFNKVTPLIDPTGKQIADVTILVGADFNDKIFRIESNK